MSASGAKIAAVLVFPAAVYACGLDDTVITTSGPTDGGAASNSDATISGDGAVTGDGSVGSDSGSDGSTLPPTLVYGVSQTGLYSLDVNTSLLTKIGTISTCGNYLLDIALDTSGSLVAITQNGGNRGVGTMSMAGACGTPHQADSTHTLSIGYFGATSAQLFELRDDSKDLELLDPTTGNDNSLNGSALPGNAFTDIACSSAKCYVTVDHSHCAPDPGVGGSCVWSINSDGGGGAQVGTPIAFSGAGGLAYHDGTLFLFSAFAATVYKIPVSPPGAATTVPVNGATPPATWSGAASSSTFP